MSLLFRFVALALFTMHLYTIVSKENWTGIDTIKYFQYFTVQSNVLVILYLFLYKTRLFMYLRNMILGMILITFAIYWSVIFPFELMTSDVDFKHVINEATVHLINPVLMLVFWHKCAKRYICPKWTIWLLPTYGVVYMIANQIMAMNVTGFIPYLFIDLDKLGMLLFSVFFTLLLVGFGCTSYIIWSRNVKIANKNGELHNYLLR